MNSTLTVCFCCFIFLFLTRFTKHSFPCFLRGFKNSDLFLKRYQALYMLICGYKITKTILYPQPNCGFLGLYHGDKVSYVAGESNNEKGAFPALDGVFCERK